MSILDLLALTRMPYGLVPYGDGFEAFGTTFERTDEIDRADDAGWAYHEEMT